MILNRKNTRITFFNLLDMQLTISCLFSTLQKTKRKYKFEAFKKLEKKIWSGRIKSSHW